MLLFLVVRHLLSCQIPDFTYFSFDWKMVVKQEAVMQTDLNGLKEIRPVYGWSSLESCRIKVFSLLLVNLMAILHFFY